MATLNASTQFEIRFGATANMVNGGGFNIANANFMTDLACDTDTGNTNSPVVSSATYSFVAGDDEAWLYIKSGSNWTPGFYQIASVTAGKATLRAAIGEACQYSSTTNTWGANTVAGCATTGTPTGGTFGVDYSQQNAAITTQTDYALTAGGVTLTSASASFTQAMIGNIIHITAGTNAVVGWYEIVNYTNTTTVTINEDCSTGGNMSSATGYIGGALSLNSTLDDDFFEWILGTHSADGITTWVKEEGSVISLGESFSLSGAGGSGAWGALIGYKTIRGDGTVASNRPTISATNSYVLYSPYYFKYENLIIKGGGSNYVLQTLGNNNVINCDIIQVSSTANRVALMSNGPCFYFKSRFTSYRGRASSHISSNSFYVFCVFSHSDVGLRTENSNSILFGCILNNNVTKTVDHTSGFGGYYIMINNTLYGAENKLGTGFNAVASTHNIVNINNIFYGFVNGIDTVTTTSIPFHDFNCFYNNTNNLASSDPFYIGKNDITGTNPSFTNVTQITGTGATTDGSGVLTDSGKTFITSGVVAGDIVQVLSGSAGTNTGHFLIDSLTETTLTCTVPQGIGNSKTSISYQITTGHNFLPTGSI